MAGWGENAHLPAGLKSVCRFFGITRKIGTSSHDTTGTQGAEFGGTQTCVAGTSVKVTNHGRLLG
jgi:hypothetical protein